MTYLSLVLQRKILYYSQLHPNKLKEVFKFPSDLKIIYIPNGARINAPFAQLGNFIQKLIVSKMLDGRSALILGTNSIDNTMTINGYITFDRYKLYIASFGANHPRSVRVGTPIETIIEIIENHKFNFLIYITLNK